MIKTVSLLLSLMVPSWVFAYGDTGHKAVAAIAWQHLTPFAKQNVAGILGPGKGNFIKASVWADHIKSDQRFNYLKPMHYVNLPKDATDYQKSRDCKQDACIVEAIRIFTRKSKEGTSKEKRLAVRMLIHLLADIHQPLHAGLKEDRGGNGYNVTYKNQSLSLHKLWDHQLIKRIGQNWQAISETILAYNIQVPLYEPEIWAQESHGLVMAFVYRAQRNKVVTTDYLIKADAVSKQQLAKAGWRLAMWLNKLW